MIVLLIGVVLLARWRRGLSPEPGLDPETGGRPRGQTPRQLAKPFKIMGLTRKFKIPYSLYTKNCTLGWCLGYDLSSCRH